MIAIILLIIVAGFAISATLYASFAYNSQHDPEESFDLLFPPNQQLIKKREQEIKLNIARKVA
jgi:hypothetical protein